MPGGGTELGHAVAGAVGHEEVTTDRHDGRRASKPKCLPEMVLTYDPLDALTSVTELLAPLATKRWEPATAADVGASKSSVVVHLVGVAGPGQRRGRACAPRGRRR